MAEQKLDQQLKEFREKLIKSERGSHTRLGGYHRASYSISIDEMIEELKALNFDKNSKKISTRCPMFVTRKRDGFFACLQMTQNGYTVFKKENKELKEWQSDFFPDEFKRVLGEACKTYNTQCEAGNKIKHIFFEILWKQWHPEKLPPSDLKKDQIYKWHDVDDNRLYAFTKLLDLKKTSEGKKILADRFKRPQHLIGKSEHLYIEIFEVDICNDHKNLQERIEVAKTCFQRLVKTWAIDFARPVQIFTIARMCQYVQGSFQDNCEGTILTIDSIFDVHDEISDSQEVQEYNTPKSCKNAFRQKIKFQCDLKATVKAKCAAIQSESSKDKIIQNTIVIQLPICQDIAGCTVYPHYFGSFRYFQNEQAEDFEKTLINCNNNAILEIDKISQLFKHYKQQIEKTEEKLQGAWKTLPNAKNFQHLLKTSLHTLWAEVNDWEKSEKNKALFEIYRFCVERDILPMQFKTKRQKSNFCPAAIPVWQSRLIPIELPVPKDVFQNIVLGSEINVRCLIWSFWPFRLRTIWVPQQDPDEFGEWHVDKPLSDIFEQVLEKEMQREDARVNTIKKQNSAWYNTTDSGEKGVESAVAEEVTMESEEDSGSGDVVVELTRESDEEDGGSESTEGGKDIESDNGEGGSESAEGGKDMEFDEGEGGSGSASIGHKRKREWWHDTPWPTEEDLFAGETWTDIWTIYGINLYQQETWKKWKAAIAQNNDLFLSNQYKAYLQQQKQYQKYMQWLETHRREQYAEWEIADPQWNMNARLAQLCLESNPFLLHFEADLDVQFGRVCCIRY